MFLRIAQTTLYTACALAVVASLAPAANAGVQADCVVGITPLQSPSITCFSISGGEARGKADCKFAPDTNTAWISRPGGSTGPACFFDARGAVLEIRSF
jgi:hypothetical protein